MSIERFSGAPASPWETLYGFSRVVRYGDIVHVGGTTSVDELGFIIGVTPYEQAVEVLRKVHAEFTRVGVEIASVVALTAYVTDISRAEEVGRAFGEVFAGVAPLLTMVEVSALIDPRMLVEIEAKAYVGGAAAA